MDGRERERERESLRALERSECESVGASSRPAAALPRATSVAADYLGSAAIRRVPSRSFPQWSAAPRPRALECLANIRRALTPLAALSLLAAFAAHSRSFSLYGAHRRSSAPRRSALCASPCSHSFGLVRIRSARFGLVATLALHIARCRKTRTPRPRVCILTANRGLCAAPRR